MLGGCHGRVVSRRYKQDVSDISPVSWHIFVYEVPSIRRPCAGTRSPRRLRCHVSPRSKRAKINRIIAILQFLRENRSWV